MRKKILPGILLILVLFISGFVIWGLTPQQAEAAALNGMENSEMVQVIEEGDHILFLPTQGKKSTGIIFYPGGHVDPRAYAHLIQQISADGYPVILFRMPLNLAILGNQKANTVPEAFPEIKNWVLCGHSLGGAMSAMYTEQHPDQINGLILWGSYPAGSVDLSQYEGPVLSVFGSLDGLSSPEEIKNTKKNLPANTIYFEIEGGNHAQFGSYGFQNGDLEAEISAETQQEIIVRETLNFLSEHFN